jgi:hypothetical protein
VKHPPADDGSDNTEKDIEDHTFATVVHNVAGNQTGYKTENKPSKDRHSIPPGAATVSQSPLIWVHFVCQSLDWTIRLAILSEKLVN